MQGRARKDRQANNKTLDYEQTQIRPNYWSKMQKSKEPIMVNYLPGDEVKEFTCLASTVTADGDSYKEIRIRIIKARQTWAAFNHVWG